MSSQYAEQILSEQVKVLYDASLVSLGVTLFNAFVLFALEINQVPHFLLVPWMTLMFSLTSYRLIELRRFKNRISQDSVVDQRRFLRSFSLWSSIAAALWGSTAIFLHFITDVHHQVFIAFLVAGMACGGVTTLFVHWPTLARFIPLSLALLVLVFFSLPSLIEKTMGGMILLLMGAFLLMGKRMNTQFIENCSLRFQAMKNQRDLNQYLAMLLETERLADIGGWELNTEDNRIKWSQHINALSGQAFNHEISLQEIVDLFSVDDQDKLLRSLGRSIAIGEQFDFVAPATLPDNGGQRWFRLVGRGGISSGNKVNLIHGAIQDITASKQLELELIAAREQALQQAVALRDVVCKMDNQNKQLAEARELAEKATRQKALFFANVNHELRTPLNAILGFSRQLLKRNSNEWESKLLQRTVTAAEHLMLIVNDVLDFSKIEAGKLNIENVPTQIAHLIEESCVLFSQAANEKGIQFTCVMTSQVPSIVIVDPFRTKQILTNLISNAIKFTPQGSVKVAIDWKKQAESESFLEMTVADTGIGIAKENFANLMIPFHQAEDSVARHYGGSGLGLSITKQLVELMGGRLNVVSEEGVGSQFTATIKAAKSEGKLLH